MADCKYCGQSAGLLREVHNECEERHTAGLSEIKGTILRAIVENGKIEKASESVTDIAKSAHVSEPEKRDSIIEAWEMAADHFLNDGALEPVEELRLNESKKALNLAAIDLDRRGMQSRVQKAAIVRQIIAGEVPAILPDIPLESFNFQKMERPVWSFKNVEYHEDRNKRVSKGGTTGISVRVASGVYLRFGGFKGDSVTRTERLHVDTGILVLTDRHLWFSGPKKSFRIRYEKIVSHTPYSDGFAVVRDASNAMPQIFVTGDGWFALNLLVNLSRKSLEH